LGIGDAHTDIHESAAGLADMYGHMMTTAESDVCPPP
jgi:hypothetical protein